MKKVLIPKVSSIAELRAKARGDPRYAALLLKSSANLGGPDDDVEKAFNWLNLNALETDEEGVVGEINALRSMV